MTTKPTKLHQTNLKKFQNKDNGLQRSPKWPGVRKKHLKLHPTCAACGTKNDLDVHHIHPFHIHPELELDPKNLITLCMESDCHLYIGHGSNFKAYNPNAVEDAKEVNERPEKLKGFLTEIRNRAKKNRLFE